MAALGVDLVSSLLGYWKSDNRNLELVLWQAAGVAPA
jgi:hypothetical protein